MFFLSRWLYAFQERVDFSLNWPELREWMDAPATVQDAFDFDSTFTDTGSSRISSKEVRRRLHGTGFGAGGRGRGAGGRRGLGVDCRNKSESGRVLRAMPAAFSGVLDHMNSELYRIPGASSGRLPNGPFRQQACTLANRMLALGMDSGSVHACASRAFLMPTPALWARIQPRLALLRDPHALTIALHMRTGKADPREGEEVSVRCLHVPLAPHLKASVRCLHVPLAPHLKAVIAPMPYLRLACRIAMLLRSQS